MWYDGEAVVVVVGRTRTTSPTTDCPDGDCGGCGGVARKATGKQWWRNYGDPDGAGGWKWRSRTGIGMEVVGGIRDDWI